jgi:hypothetical protein
MGVNPKAEVGEGKESSTEPRRQTVPEVGVFAHPAHCFLSYRIQLVAEGWDVQLTAYAVAVTGDQSATG